MTDLPKAAIERIAKKAGAERVGDDAIISLLAKAEIYIANLSATAFDFAKHAGRKTLKAEDVELAAAKNED